MNVVVVCCDRIPTKLLGVYGSEWVETPNIDRLAVQGVVFDSVFAEAMNPGIVADAVVAKLNAGQPTVDVGLLSDRAFRQASSSTWIFVEESTDADESHRDSCERFFASAAAWWDARDPQTPSLLWLEFALADAKWIPPRQWRGRHREEDGERPEIHHAVSGDVAGRYSASDLERIAAGWADRIAYFDSVLGAFLQSIDESTDEPPCIVFTAGAGEALGEHGWIGAAGAPYHEVLHVPFVIRLPSSRRAARRTQLMTLADAGDAIVELFGRRDAILERPTSEKWAVECATNSGTALSTKSWKLIQTPAGRVELFALPEDRLDMNDIATRLPGVVDGLTAALEFFRNPESPTKEPLR